ncbi:MAG: VWA domain-containing protein [Bryobacterales bacterium]|nr:VWA domain-containing protein [Bryobacterales bacterium]
MENRDEYLRRWRLILGGGDSDGTGQKLKDRDEGMDRTLDALYDPDRKAGLGASAPGVARWLGDIREYFPTQVVRVMQGDALTRLGLKQMLLEPELLEAVEPDIHLVGTLLTLRSLLPNRAKETARLVIRKVVEDILRRLEEPLRQAVTGALHRGIRNRRPRHREIDWVRTVQANLRHWQPEYKSLIPERRVGFGRRQSSMREIILCVDQSGSMAASVVYAGVFASVLAMLPALSTKLVVFDTAVVDLSAELHDPVELLFGIQLGGGTDIHQALGYCLGLVERPNDTVLVLLSDLYEGGNAEGMVKRAAALVAAGVKVIVLLALSDEGTPGYDHQMAARLAALGIPSFACTPDAFPDLMAAAFRDEDIPAPGSPKA